MRKPTGRLYIALGVIVVAATMACASRDDTDVNRAKAEEIAEDGEALRQLQAAGSDLSKPHKLDFYLVVPAESSAEAAAAAIRPLGYDVTVYAGEEEGSWVCRCSRTMRPTLQEVTIARSRFNVLASKYQGVYGGWTASVER